MVAIAGGGRHSLALQSDGTLVAWGDDPRTNRLPVGCSNVVAIAAGEDFSLAVMNDGSPWLMRQPADAELFGGGTVNLIASAMGSAPFTSSGAAMEPTLQIRYRILADFDGNSGLARAGYTICWLATLLWHGDRSSGGG